MSQLKQASKSVGREDESATTRVSQASQRVVQREGGRVSVSGTRVASRVQAGLRGVCARSGKPATGRGWAQQDNGLLKAPRTGALATAVQEVRDGVLDAMRSE